MQLKHTFPIYGVLCLLFMLSIITGWSVADGENKTNSPADGIFVYAGAGLKIPVQEAADQYTKNTGIPVDVSFAGSGALLAQMELTHLGDIYIPGGQPDYLLAKEKQLVGEPVYLAYHVPVLAVQKGNPKNIQTVSDLANPEMKVALGDVKATAIGKASEVILKNAEVADLVEKNVLLRTTTINELGLALETGQIDATILSIDQIKPDIMEMIPLPQSVNKILTIPSGVTSFSAHPDTAADFITYLSSEEGKKIFSAHGFPSYPNATFEEK